MKPLALPILAAAGVAAAVISTPPPELGGKWIKHHLSRYFWAEGACVADVDSDGNVDVLSGPYWYAGPDFQTANAIYVATENFEHDGETIAGFPGELSGKNGYSNNFLSYAEDFNADGRPDYLVVGWPGKETFWYENPVDSSKPWPRHTAMKSTDNESPRFVDMDGDGIKDLLCMSGGKIGYASYDPKQPEAEWKWFAVTPEDKKTYQRYTHGIGSGDINGDGLTDILEARGWWERPVNWDGEKTWNFHPVDFGKGGAQMFGYDVNADGRTDVITSIEAHGFGVAWFEQDKKGGWERHLITGTATDQGSTGIVFSQPHAMDLTDLDGNGTLDIVTGKRFWAHGPEKDPEPNQPAVLYAFFLHREGDSVSYRAEIIDDSSGVGCQVMAADVNGDARLDVVVGNKKGCFVHLRK